MDHKVSLRFKIALGGSIAVIAIAMILLVAMHARSPVGVEELSIDVGDIQSYAAEGGFIATQIIGVSVTRSYAKVHTQMWRRKIDDLARKYRSRKSQSTWAQSHGEVQALAIQLHAAADAVSVEFAQNETAEAATAQLKQIESRARALKSTLEHEAK